MQVRSTCARRGVGVAGLGGLGRFCLSERQQTVSSRRHEYLAGILIYLYLNTPYHTIPTLHCTIPYHYHANTVTNTTTITITILYNTLQHIEAPKVDEYNTLDLFSCESIVKITSNTIH